jgi:hypothetical protein
MLGKSQHGCKVPTFEPQDTIEKLLLIINVISWLSCRKIVMGLVLRVGSGKLLDPTLNTSLKARLQSVLSDLRLGTMCEPTLIYDMVKNFV